MKKYACVRISIHGFYREPNYGHWREVSGTATLGPCTLSWTAILNIYVPRLGDLGLLKYLYVGEVWNASPLFRKTNNWRGYLFQTGCCV